MDEISHPEAGSLYVDRSDGTRGSKGTFFVVYTEADATSRWGYLCGNCETTDNAVDSMGRIQCNECSNVTKPEEWDAAHE